MSAPQHPPPGPYPGAPQGYGHPQAGPQQGHPYGTHDNSAATAATKNRNRGCRIAALSGCSVLLVATLVGSFLLYRAARDSPLGDIAGAVGEGVKIWQEARSAPGTEGMRKAGCQEALVVNLSELARITKHLDAGAPDFSENEEGFSTMAICSMGMFAAADGRRVCDKVAKAFLNSGGQPEGRFILQVNKSGGNKPVCSEVYLQDGSHERSIDYDVNVPE